jgi:hypothetical protein
MVRILREERAGEQLFSLRSDVSSPLGCGLGHLLQSILCWIDHIYLTIPVLMGFGSWYHEHCM